MLQAAWALLLKLLINCLCDLDQGLPFSGHPRTHQYSKRVLIQDHEGRFPMIFCVEEPWFGNTTP